MAEVVRKGIVAGWCGSIFVEHIYKKILSVLS